MSALGLLAALAVLIILALRGVNIIIASIVASVIVAVTNDLELTKALSEYYAFGPLGAFTFMGRFFLLFLTGAMFGTLMAESRAASSIAHALADALGTRHTLFIIVAATALLTYGGVVVFVVVFVIYPLGLQLVRRARLPRRLLLAAAGLGAGTFTMTALPGTPSVHNVISASALGTDLYAGAVLGLIAAATMLILGLLYLNRAARKYEDWEPPAGHYDQENVRFDENEVLPSWQLSVLPMAAVILTILVPKLVGLEVAVKQPILWPSLALVIGCLMIYLLFPIMRSGFMKRLGIGANNAIMPLVNTAVVIGFGGVVTQTSGFREFATLMPSLDLPPLISLVVTVNVLSGIVGSATGGLQIFMQTLAQDYLALGIAPETLHRIATVASGGLDSLPHCGAVVAFLTIMRVSHREGYGSLAIVTVVLPLIALAVTVIAAMLLPGV